jgi:hypothetical protein
MILLKCSQVTIGVSVFYNRGDFLYIGAPSDPINDLKWFNDVPRGMQR